MFPVKALLRLIVCFLIQQTGIVLKNGQVRISVLLSVQAVFFEQSIEMGTGKT